MKRFIIYLLLPLGLLTGCSSGEESTGYSKEKEPTDYSKVEEEPQSASAFYERYAQRPELKVAEVDGFKLCDSVRVDVVMMQAESDDAWRQLTEEFDIRGDEGTVSWLGDPDTPAQRTEWTGKPALRVIASLDKRTIGFYRLDNEKQYDALIDYQLKSELENEN